jgi:hypothetical protein
MPDRKISFALLPLLSLLLSSCGGSPAGVSPSNYTSINSNWLITGATSEALNFSQNPYIGAALAASGNSIYGDFTIELRCAEGFTLGLGVPISGTISSDGTFMLSGITLPDLSVQFELHGTIPGKSQSTWPGTYSLHVSPSNTTNCTFNQDGSFNAVPYSLLQGTFSGSVTDYLGSTVTVNLQISQLAPVVAAVGTRQVPGVSTPYSGTVTVTGSPCFVSGTIQSGSISGDVVSASVLMNDGTSAALLGYLGDATATELHEFLMVRIPVGTGTCARASVGVPLLKRQ